MAVFVVISYLSFSCFVSQSTYEEIRLNVSEVGDKTKYLKEGMDCTVLFWNGKVFSNSNTFPSVVSSLILFVCLVFFFFTPSVCFQRTGYFLEVLKRLICKLLEGGICIHDYSVLGRSLCYELHYLSNI